MRSAGRALLLSCGPRSEVAAWLAPDQVRRSGFGPWSEVAFLGDDLEGSKVAQCRLDLRPRTRKRGRTSQRDPAFLPRAFRLIADQRSVTFPYRYIFIRAGHTPRGSGGAVVFIRGGHTAPSISPHIEALAAVRPPGRLRPRPPVGVEPRGLFREPRDE